MLKKADNDITIPLSKEKFFYITNFSSEPKNIVFKDTTNRNMCDNTTIFVRQKFNRNQFTAKL